ncbi:hypothetical protein [Silvanigrella aquatica]|uniref:Uncharacterized protein n=1 Tax=Silvanigrella aquatica TaxID=1915309 RepID=A0A1L4CZ39_9BACT|nr:hypothetical protein [Silvanigrella aquatica]APJ03216.1 hypothetical protein AXG55_04575 [Silvanigrella aquatica]
MLKKVYTLSILLYSTCLFANQNKEASQGNKENPKEFVNVFCEKYDGQKDFYQKISQDILINEDRRAYFANALTQKKLPGCEKALTDYVKKILEDKEYTPKPGEQAFLSLALMAKIPEAREIIEREIDRGYLSSWIDDLKTNNYKGYIEALNKWITRVANEIRRKDNTKLQDSSLYGIAPSDGKGIKYPEMVKIWTPILMNRYLTEMINEKDKLTEEQFGYLNIIFAATTTSYRETFMEQITQIVANNPQIWILSFRREQPWVQFRLFPIMKKVESGEIKREIVWLSKYHQDNRIRTLALNTLEALAKAQNIPQEKKK